MTHPLATPPPVPMPLPSGGRTPRVRRRAALAIAILVVALARPAATATPVPSVVTADEPDVTFGLQPTQEKGKDFRANFVYDLAPGAEVKDEFRVRNLGSRKQTFTLFAGDAFNAQTGAIDLLPTGAESDGIGTWITLDKTEVELASGQFTDIPFTLKIPAGAQPGDHTAAIVASLGTRSNNAGPAVAVDRRIGSRVLVRVAGALNPQMSIANLKTSFEQTLNPIGGGTTTVSFRVTNSGNVRMGANQSIKFGSPIGIPSKSFTPPPVPELLPGNSIVQSFTVEGVYPTVRTSTKVTVTPIPVRDGDSFDAGVTVRAKTGMWTMPWAFLTLVAILLALGWYLRRRRQQQNIADERRLQSLLDARLTDGAGRPVPTTDASR